MIELHGGNWTHLVVGLKVIAVDGEPAGLEHNHAWPSIPFDVAAGHLAVGETVILLHPPLPLVGVSIVMERERQQNDSLANGYGHPHAESSVDKDPDDVIDDHAPFDLDVVIGVGDHNAHVV